MNHYNNNIADMITAGEKIRLFAALFIAVLLSEKIGSIEISLGPAKVILLPLLWALIIGTAISLVSKRTPAWMSINNKTQDISSLLLQPALLILMAKLGLLVGGSIPVLLKSGAGLILQEFGHFFGTMLFGLPIALLLGIKREAIGATFSIGRETSIAIISERFGMQSPEGHGVLAEYITGTVFGAIFISVLAGIVASLHIFNPLALAMGAGVGSGSLMAAATGAIAAQQDSEVAKDVVALAAASNLITSVIGTYFMLFISLPFTVWAYNILEPILGSNTNEKLIASKQAQGLSQQSQSTEIKVSTQMMIWIAICGLSIVGTSINHRMPVINLATIMGFATLLGVVLLGYICYRLAMRKLPTMVWVSLVGIALTYPRFPYSVEFAELTANVNFLTLTTPILALAGISIAKDLPILQRLGWRIVLVSCLANAGSFLGAAIIAQFFVSSSHH